MADERAVVDASVLYKRHMRNALVWHAIEGYFQLYWSPEILAETRRNLIARNQDRFGDERPEQVERVLERVTSSVVAAGAGGEVAVADLEQMTNDEKDRHVLAAAVAIEAPFRGAWQSSRVSWLERASVARALR